MKNLKENYLIWLLLGVVLVWLSHYRWGVAPLAWVASAPFLIAVSLKSFSGGFKPWGLVLLAVCIAYNAQLLKIISDPIPWFIAPAFAMPMALGFYSILFIWHVLDRRLNTIQSLFSWVALVTISDWVSIQWTDFGIWGTLVSSQPDNLILLQLLSITGITGIAAIMSLVSVTTAFVVLNRFRSNTKAVVSVSALVVVILSFGIWRLAQTEEGVNLVSVASVTTDLHLEGSQFPSEDQLVVGTNELFNRSQQAVDDGASLVVWNEGATLVFPGTEENLISRGQEFSRANSVDLVMAYLIVLDENNFWYDNKYVWITETGEVIEQYSKNFPVPGEPMNAGSKSIEVLDRPYGKVAGAICYDYDFPKLARTHSQLGAELVVVPSSDWLGIQPYHAQMTRMRAIEGGFSVVRPVRWSTSVAYDNKGRLLQSANYFEGERIMMAQVPVFRIDTLYSRVGDWPAYVSIVYLVGLLAWYWLRQMILGSLKLKTAS